MQILASFPSSMEQLPDEANLESLLDVEFETRTNNCKLHYAVYFVVHPVFDGTSRADWSTT